MGTVWGDEVVEVKLGPRDMLLNRVDRPHGFRNDGVEPVLMQITVGSGTPEMPVHVCHPRTRTSSCARRFGARPGKTSVFAPTATGASRSWPSTSCGIAPPPVWDKRASRASAYVGDGGAPAGTAIAWT